MNDRSLSKSGRMVRLIGGTILTGVGFTGAVKGSAARALTAGIGIGSIIEGITGRHLLEMLDIANVEE